MRHGASGEGRFDGHLRDLGPTPLGLFTQLHDLVNSSAGIWAHDGQRFSQAFDGLENIVLMFPRDYPASHLNSKPTEHWGHWRDSVSPMIDFVAARLSLVLFAPAKVIISKLDANSVIAEHIDRNPSSQVPHKVHIPIVTSPDVIFTVEDSAYNLAPGRAYELNNLIRHAVYNRGDADRIHLIIEVYSTAVNGK
jgi:hypothetical protein